MSGGVPAEDYELIEEFAEFVQEPEGPREPSEALKKLPGVLARQRMELVSLYYELRQEKRSPQEVENSPKEEYYTVKEALQSCRINRVNIASMDDLRDVDFIVYPPSDKKIDEISGVDSVSILVMERDLSECVSFINYLCFNRRIGWVIPARWTTLVVV